MRQIRGTGRAAPGRRNGTGCWVEFSPQLDPIAIRPIAMRNGFAVPSAEAGLGIAWGHAAVEAIRVAGTSHIID